LYYEVQHENQAKGDEKWFYVNYENQATCKIFWVDYENQADIKVFKVIYENQAKWRTSNRFRNRLE